MFLIYVHMGNWPCSLVAMFWTDQISLAIFVEDHPVTISDNFF